MQVYLNIHLCDYYPHLCGKHSNFWWLKPMLQECCGHRGTSSEKCSGYLPALTQCIQVHAVSLLQSSCCIPSMIPWWTSTQFKEVTFPFLQPVFPTAEVYSPQMTPEKLHLGANVPVQKGRFPEHQEGIGSNNLGQKGLDGRWPTLAECGTDLIWIEVTEHQSLCT